MTAYNETITESVNNIGSILLNSELLAIVIDDINCVIIEDIQALARIIETTYLNDIIATSTSFGFTITDQTKLNDLIYISLQAILNEDINGLDNIVDIFKQIEKIRNIINVLDTSSSNYLGTIALAVSLTISDLLSQIDILEENIEISETFSELLRMSFQILEDIQNDDIVSPYTIFFQLTTDSFETSDIPSTTALFHKLIIDGFNIIIGDGEYGNIYSGWVMNPENYAISNYNNFNFDESTLFIDDNLFCSRTGLYKFGGTLDETSYITSKIQSAIMSFETSNLKQVHEILLGVNNSGKVILSVSIDSKETAYYQLNPNSNGLSTQQIKVGKGLYGKIGRASCRERV